MNSTTESKCQQARAYASEGMANLPEEEDSRDNCPSPYIGSREAPLGDWSSQEDYAVSCPGGGDGNTKGKQKENNTSQLSPDWDKMIEEEVTELETSKMGDNKDSTVNDENSTKVDEANREDGAATTQEQGGQEIKDPGQKRQSERLKKQGLGAMKIADKSKLATLKRNLEGKHL